MNALKLFNNSNRKLSNFICKNLLFNYELPYSTFVSRHTLQVKTLFSTWISTPLKPERLKLIPISTTVVPSCGFKVKGKLKKRCKDCYLVREDGVMKVLCSSYPRHKQVALTKREKYTWIISHCTQSKNRPY